MTSGIHCKITGDWTGKKKGWNIQTNMEEILTVLTVSREAEVA